MPVPKLDVPTIRAIASDPGLYFDDLKRRCIEAGVSQNKLAEAANMDPPRVSRLLRERANVELATVHKLETAFDVALRARKGAGS